jgi:hypothetical protein
MTDISIEGTVYSVTMNPDLDRLVRSNDPSLQKMVEDRIRTLLRSGGTRFRYTLSRSDFTRLTHLYGEQYVADPGADLDQYFDIVNGRLFSRSVPTQLAVLYLFGSGVHYRPNTGALSAAGEAVAGFCMEQFGYRALVRPLGIMPDIVLWTNRAGVVHLALAEAKASTRQDPERLTEKSVCQFLVDIKTRAQGFSHHYEGYLIASQFCDGGKVLCSCLRVDLGCYAKSHRKPTGPEPGIHSTVHPYAEPEERLQGLSRLQAETGYARDEYLTSLLSEEATRSAMLALILLRKSLSQEAQGSLSQEEIDAYIFQVASKLGLTEQWLAGQELIRGTKAKEKAQVSKALVRFRKPNLDIE